jgi:hypothetical protein
MYIFSGYFAVSQEVTVSGTDYPANRIGDAGPRYSLVPSVRGWDKFDIQKFVNRLFVEIVRIGCGQRSTILACGCCDEHITGVE